MSSNYDGGMGGGMFTGPYMRALQMKSMIDDIKYKREMRDQHRQQYMMEMEDRKRGHAMEDFKNHMALQQMGYTPAEPGATQQGDAQIQMAMRAGGGMAPGGERNLLKTPVGMMRAPSQQDQANQMQAGARAKVAAEDYGRQAREQSDRASGRSVRMKFQGQDLWVAADKAPGVAKQIRELEQGVKGGQIIGGRVETNQQTGAMTFVGLDATTRQPIEIPFNTTMVPKPTAKTQQDYEAEYDTGPDNPSGSREEMIADYMSKALIKAGVAEGADPSDEQKAKAEAIAARDIDIFIKDKRTKGVAKLRQAGQAQQTAPQQGASVPRRSLQGHVISSANLAVAAKRKGMTPEKFKAEWVAQGGSVMR